MKIKGVMVFDDGSGFQFNGVNRNVPEAVIAALATYNGIKEDQRKPLKELHVLCDDGLIIMPDAKGV